MDTYTIIDAAAARGGGPGPALLVARVLLLDVATPSEMVANVTRCDSAPKRAEDSTRHS
jgi:hypothetical protein